MEVSAKIKEGDKAPDFALLNQDGKEVKLSDHLGKNIVLYFYPKDDTGICRKQACAFRDSYDVFTDAGAVVLGVSQDSVESHKEFAKKRHLPFDVLSDTDNKVAASYDVKKFLGMIMLGRVTFVIDKEGTVQYRFSKLLEGQGHVDKALKVLESLR